MKRLPIQRRTLALLAAIVSLLTLFVYVALRAGPMAPVSVTLSKVETQSIAPALYGVGTAEARYTYKIGPTFSGRVKRLDVHVGDRVRAGQVLGEMDPVDLDERLRSLESANKRAGAALREADVRRTYAQTQASRYEKLYGVRAVSEETFTTKQQELQIADAALSAAREDISRTRADREALLAQQRNLRLVAPVDGLVAARDADPGSTIVVGQSVVEVIDPGQLWINARFDQVSASGLAAGLKARVVLRSRSNEYLAGYVLRAEPVADAVTEETLIKVAFDTSKTLPPVGELAEVTVVLPALAAAPVIPNAAVRREDGRLGVWQFVDGAARFTPVTLGASDLDGLVQVRAGLKPGDQVVVYTDKALNARSRVRVVEHILDAAR